MEEPISVQVVIRSMEVMTTGWRDREWELRPHYFIEHGYIWAETERKEEVSYKPALGKGVLADATATVKVLRWALVMHKNKKESGGWAKKVGRVVGDAGQGVTEARSCGTWKAAVWNLGLTVSEKGSHWKVYSRLVIWSDLGLKNIILQYKWMCMQNRDRLTDIKNSK